MIFHLENKVHVLSFFVYGFMNDFLYNITGCKIGTLCDPINAGFVVPAVMPDQKLCDPIALLGKLNIKI